MLNATVEFWMLALLVAMVQGGSQALSRSLYASLCPTAKSGEFFGFYAIMEKFASIVGPLIFAFAGIALGSSRPAILSLILLFLSWVVILLSRVDIAEGQRVARDEDTEHGIESTLRPTAGSLAKPKAIIAGPTAECYTEATGSQTLLLELQRHAKALVQAAPDFELLNQDGRVQCASAIFAASA